jgi:hypothetical protein
MRWFGLSISLIHFPVVMASDGGNAPRGMVLRPELSTAHDLCDKPVIPSGHAGA